MSAVLAIGGCQSTGQVVTNASNFSATSANFVRPPPFRPSASQAHARASRAHVMALDETRFLAFANVASAIPLGDIGAAV